VNLAADDPESAQRVKVRFFGGLSLAEAAEIVGLPRSSAYELSAYARRMRCLIGRGK